MVAEVVEQRGEWEAGVAASERTRSGERRAHKSRRAWKVFVGRRFRGPSPRTRRPLGGRHGTSLKGFAAPIRLGVRAAPAKYSQSPPNAALCNSWWSRYCPRRPTRHRRDRQTSRARPGRQWRHGPRMRQYLNRKGQPCIAATRSGDFVGSTSSKLLTVAQGDVTSEASLNALIKPKALAPSSMPRRLLASPNSKSRPTQKRSTRTAWSRAARCASRMRCRVWSSSRRVESPSRHQPSTSFSTLRRMGSWTRRLAARMRCAVCTRSRAWPMRALATRLYDLAA